MHNSSLYYKQDNWEINQSMIKGYFNNGTWIINSQDIEYVQQKSVVITGSPHMYDVYIKKRNIQQPYFIGRYSGLNYSMKDALAAYASAYNIPVYNDTPNGYSQQQNTYSSPQQYGSPQAAQLTNTQYQQYSYQQQNQAGLYNQQYQNQGAMYNGQYSSRNYSKPRKKRGTGKLIVIMVLVLLLIGAAILYLTNAVGEEIFSAGIVGFVILVSLIFGRRGGSRGGYYHDYYDHNYNSFPENHDYAYNSNSDFDDCEAEAGSYGDSGDYDDSGDD